MALKKRRKRSAVSITALKKLRFQAMLVKDGNRCLKCGATGGLAPSHIFPQGRYRNMAWELDNVKPLCNACHMFWWHKHPTESGEWFRQKFPERYARLLKMSQEYCPKPDLIKVKSDYEAIINHGLDLQSY